MKNFILHIFLLIFLVVINTTGLLAQNKNGLNNKVERCYTMENLENQIKADPTLPAKWKARGELIQQQNSQHKQNNILNDQAVTVIPVVFHLVISAGQQAIVTDALLQRQIDVLNRDFAGLNPDSSKLPAAFKAVFGHSEIRFCLAKRTPANVATNGIERRVSNATFTGNTLAELKNFANGGLDQWDGTKYLNIWLANFDDLLGIATFPFSDPENEQGVCIDWGVIDLACGSPFNGVYDGGRTLVHEIGHYFYLWHIWGDENGCTGDDFRIQDGFPLSANCTDDTPNQAKSTSGCLSGVQTDGCSSTAPGFMYQNYMDYTNDGCYGMFTIAQVCRMQACIDNYRASLKSSNGCAPVVAVNNDVRVSEILNPVSRGFACGKKTSYCDLQLTPQVLIVNDGDAPLTSLTFTIRVDNVIVAVQNWTGNLATSEFAYVNIDAFTPPTGTHTLKISTGNPNGGIDGRPVNDFAEARYEILPPALNPPIAAQSFEGVTFPPDNWRVINPDGGITWAKTTSAGNPGIASARLSAYSYNSKQQIDYLLTPKIQTAGSEFLILNFNLAYAKYNNDMDNWDQLEVVYSEDCGVTWKPTGYKKSGDALATNGGAVTGDVSFIPTPNQWRSETVKLSLCQVSSDEIVFAFKSTNNFGNNIYVDNVSVDKVNAFVTNTGLSNLLSPKGIICDGGGTGVPKFTLTNNGTATLTTVTFNISIDGGALTTHTWTGNMAKCGNEEITLPATTILPTGKHHFLIYTTNPNGVPDQFTDNDTLQSTFTIVNTVNAPLAEGFENPSFPPANFIVENPDGAITWERTTIATHTGSGALVIKNYSYPVENTTDILITPRITITNADSSFISFDYAYAPGLNYPGSTVLPLDTLEILVSKDCSLTTTTVWKKWGEELQTINDPNYANGVEFIPNQNQWKNVRIPLVDIIGSDDQVQVFFTAKSNKQNNLFIDNINVFGKTLPQRLKDQGYLVYPNPFKSTFIIHHYNPPVKLQNVQVFSTSGSLLWDKRFAGNAGTEIRVNLDKLPKGIYILKMLYSDRTIVERVVKN